MEDSWGFAHMRQVLKSHGKITHLKHIIISCAGPYKLGIIYIIGRLQILSIECLIQINIIIDSDTDSKTREPSDPGSLT